jgi:hypothetical protein
MTPDQTAEGSKPSVATAAPAPTCCCIDWFHEGEARVVEISGIRVVVRFVGRNGRRGRIAIEAPPGAVFTDAGKSP